MWWLASDPQRGIAHGGTGAAYYGVEMRSFRCGACDQLVFFDNSACLRCGSSLGYAPDRRLLLALVVDGDALRSVGDDQRRWYRCANELVAACNWLVPADAWVETGQRHCASCRLTSVRPSDEDVAAMAAFAKAEGAKRRLIDQLNGLGLPIVERAVDPERGLSFELLSARNHSVTTGHHRGVVTLDLSESDDAHREFVRQQLGEAYRTVLGHLRHEVGHYFWPKLVIETGRLDAFRDRFGDERLDYRQALESHYAGGPPSADPRPHDHVSRYATMHPWEDWAETFAHYLHIRDGLETADNFGLLVEEPARSRGAESWSPPPGTTRADLGITPFLDRWLGLTVATNALSRSMGQEDLYPFILTPTVIDKLEFVHQSVTGTHPGPAVGAGHGWPGDVGGVGR
ncbi:MAG: putative zinc-binding metallopeptidase [Actinomycetota bacterium]